MDKITHPYVPTLLDQLAGGKIGRREFLRKSTLLGLRRRAPMRWPGLADPFARARAEDMPKGGGCASACAAWRSRIRTCDFAERLQRHPPGLRVPDPHRQNNITRPYLLEKWEVSET